MAKFRIIFALLVITFLAVAQASTFKTIITIDEEKEESKQGDSKSPQRCMQQIQQQQGPLQHCHRYLQRSMGSERLSMITNHHQDQEQEQEQENLRDCCNGLQNIRNEQCSCEAVRQAVQQGQGQGQQMEEMMEKAKNLPDMCNLEPRQCQIRSMLY